MIRLSKDRVLEDFFIDDNGVITNKEGEIQKFSYYGGERPYFKSVKVHQIQMWTKYGWRDTKIWAIHHIDEDKSNNSISNLVFMTRGEHMSLHKNMYGKHHSEETKRKLSESRKGKHLSEETKRKLSISLIGHTSGMKGKTLSESAKLAISNLMKDKIWINDGKIAKRHSKFEPIPEGFQCGMLKNINRIKA